MIHFAPYEAETSEPMNEQFGRAEGTRMLFIEGTDIFVGEIRQGRKMTNLKRNWTEWSFFASESGDVRGELVPVEYDTSKGIGEAYFAARSFAATKYPQYI